MFPSLASQLPQGPGPPAEIE
ncbi:protein of unknown function [Pseudomonas sp. JV241A]|nr:protein of unknown function [Pseudomonas sp. JV241A]